MITAPQFGSSSSGQVLRGVSPQSAAAKGLSISAVAGEIKGVADSVFEHDQKIREVENAADLSEIKSELKSTYANFQTGLAEDHDYKNYGDKWEGQLGQLRKSIDSGKYAQTTREKAKALLLDFEGDSKIGIAKYAQEKAVQRAKQGYANGFKQLIEEYNPANPSDTDFQDLLRDQPWMTPEQAASSELDFKNSTKRKDVLYQVDLDPRAWLKNNESPKRGVDSALWEQGQRRAKAQIRENVSEQTDLVLNSIVEGTFNEKDLKALTPDLDAVGREKLSNYYQGRLSQENQAFLKTPDEQNRIAGEISTAIASYDPNGEGFDSNYVEIKSLMESLGSGALKDEYKKQLDGLRQGKEREIKTIDDWALKQVDEMVEAGLFGKAEKPKKIKTTAFQLLDDGYLDNEDKLRGMGFTDKQIKKVVEVDPSDKKNKGKSKAELQAEAFRDIWSNKEHTEPDDEFEKNFATHLLGGGGLNTVIDEYNDPESESSSLEATLQINKRRGKIVNEFTEWRKLHKDANRSEIQDKLESLGVDVAAGETNSSWRAPKKEVSKDLSKVNVRPGSSLIRSNIPYNGIPAAIRYNNPAAAYPRKGDEKYGLIGYGDLNGGSQGNHKIGRFPTPVHGAAANFDTFASGYKGMSVYDAVRKWRGNAGRGEKTVVPQGFDSKEIITEEFLNDSKKSTDFFKKMALHESAGKQELSSSEWLSAWKMWKAGGAKNV